MALTRPRLGQLLTNSASLTDNLTVINSAATQANVDVGFIFNRTDGVGSVANVALYWNEAGQGFVLGYTADDGSSNGNINSAGYANLTTYGLNVTSNVAIGTASTNYLTANGGATGFGPTITVAGADTNIDLNLRAKGSANVSINSPLKISGNTISINSVTGAFIVTGGVGVGGNINIAGSAGNALVTTANILAGNFVTSTGNIYAGNIVTTAQGIAGNISGVNYLLANAAIYNQSVTTGNLLTNSIYYANGAPYAFSFYSNANLTAYLTNVSIIAYNDSNVAKFLSTNFGSNSISTTGNVSAGNIISTIYTTTAGSNANLNLSPDGSGSVVVPTAQVYVTGNVTAGNVLTNTLLYANGQPYALSYFTTANVGAYLPTYTGNIQAGNVTITGNLTVANIIYTNQEVITSTETIQGNLVAAATTPSTSTTTGALVVKGGTGIAGNAIVGGNVQATGTIQYGSGQGGLIFRTLAGGTGAAIYNTNIVPSAQNYAMTTDGTSVTFNAPSGGGVYTGINNSIITTVQAGTPSATQATGQSLVVSNGLGVTGDSYFSGNLGISGNTSAGNITIGKFNNASLIINSPSSSRTATIGFVDSFNLDVQPGVGYLILARNGQNTGVGGNIQPAHRLSVGGDIYSSGNVIVTSNLTVGGTLTATGNVQFLNYEYVTNTEYVNTITATTVTAATIGNTGAALTGATLGLSGAATVGNLITTNGLFWSNGVAFATSTYSNANVASYLPIYAGNIGSGNITTTGGIFWANGQSYGSGSVYGNANVASYLTTLTTPVITQANIVSNSSTNSTSATTGAIVVPYGGVGVGGNLFVGGNIVGTYTNVTITSGAYTTTLDPYGNISLPSGNLIIGNIFAYTIGNTGTQLVGNGSGITGVAASGLAGTANTAQVALTTQITNSTSSGIYYPTFANITAGNTQLWASSTNLFFQPSSGNLTAVNFNGQYYGAIITPIQTNILQVGNLNSLSVGNVTTLFGNTVIANTTPSTSATTGALTVPTGGVGIGGNLFVGGNANINIANITNTYTGTIQSTTAFGNLWNTSNTVGNIYVGTSTANVTITGNANIANLTITNLLWPNGISYSSGIVAGITNYGNSNVAGYLPTYTGNIGAVYTLGGVYWAGNNTPFGYSNTAAAAFLPVYSGNLRAGNVTITGNLTVANIIYTNQEIITTTDTIQGNLVAASGTASTNTTSGALVVIGGAGVSGNVYAGANLNVGLNSTVSGYQVINNLTNQPALQIIGNSWRGGVGYHDFLQVTNTYTGATTPTKWFRLNSTGGLEIVNSGYSQVIFSLDDGGNVIATSNITASNRLITSGGLFWSNGVSYGSSISAAIGVYGNANVAGYLPTYGGNVLASTVYSNGYFWAANGFSIVYGNIAANAYVSNTLLPNYQGNLQAGNLLVTSASGQGGNISTGNILSSGYFWANGAPFITSNYGNANVASYLTSYGGFLFASQVRTNSNIQVGGNLIVTNDSYLLGNATITGNLIVANITYLNQEFVSTSEVVTGNLVANSGTTSSNVSTGAMVVVGGAGISGALNVGGNLTVANIQTTGTSGNISGVDNLFANVINLASNINASTGNLNISGNINYTGNVFSGGIPTGTNSYYNIAPLNLNNSLTGGVKTQLNLINTGGSSGAGSAIDFYTYTNQATSTAPGARLSVIDDGVYSASWNFYTKTPGAPSNTLTSRFSISDIGIVTVSSTSPAANVSSGALQVAGGISTPGNVYANAIYTTTGLYWAGNNNIISIGGGGGSPVGVSGAIQYNNGGVLAAANLIYNSGNNTILANGNVNSTSNVSGTMQIVGGMGVTGNIFANAVYTTTGIFWQGNGYPMSTGSLFPYLDMGFITDTTAPVPAVFDLGSVAP